MDTNAVIGGKLHEAMNTAIQARALLEQAQNAQKLLADALNAQQLLADALNNAQGIENYEVLEQSQRMLANAQGILAKALGVLDPAVRMLAHTLGMLEGIKNIPQEAPGILANAHGMLEQLQLMLPYALGMLERIKYIPQEAKCFLAQARGMLEQAQSMLAHAKSMLAQAQSMLPQAQSMLPQRQSMSVSNGPTTPKTTNSNSRERYSDPVNRTGSIFNIHYDKDYDKAAYSQQDNYPPNVLERVEKNWLDPMCENRIKYDLLRQFRDVGLESQLVGIISRITEQHGSEDKNDYDNIFAYQYIKNNLATETIQKQLDALKLKNPEIEKNIYRINGKSNVIDVSHDLIIVYNEFLEILERVEMKEEIKNTLITETSELLEKIVSSGESGKFVPTKGHLEFKNLINELINYLHSIGVKFNEFSLDPIAVMRDDIKAFIPQDKGCFSESGAKDITSVRLDGRLCTNLDCGSATAYHDTTNRKQVCTFPNIFNAVSYRMTSTLNEDNSITHQIIAYVKTDSGLFFERYVCNGGVSLNSVVELIGRLGFVYNESIQCALRNCDDESDEQDVKTNISGVSSYYVSDASVIQQLVTFFMDESDDFFQDFSDLISSKNSLVITLENLSRYLTEAFCCRAGLKTIGDLSSRVVIQKGGYSHTSGDSNIPTKVFGTVDKFCGESCLMWVLSGYISGLEYICMKSKKNYEVYKIPKNDTESLKKKLSFIFGLPREYKLKCRDKYLSFLNTTIRALGDNIGKTEFESIQYDILKIISEKYNLRFDRYFSHLKKTQQLVYDTVSDINRSNSQLINNNSINKNIGNITEMLLKIPDESYINPSSDINYLLNEYTIFSDLGTDELQYKLDNKYIKDCPGYIYLKQLLTDHCQQLKITNNLVGKILDILLPWYTAYKQHTIVESFSVFFQKNTSSLTENKDNIEICVTLLNNVDEDTIKQIMDSFIHYYMSEFANKGDANQTKDNKNSLFDFLVTGTKTEKRGQVRDKREINFVIEGDGITFSISNISDTTSLLDFFKNIALETTKTPRRGVYYNIEDDVTNWTICDNKLTIPVTIELLLNLKKYIESFRGDKNIEKIGSIYSKIEERFRNITEKINSKSAYEGDIESETKHTTDTRDRSRSRGDSERLRDDPNKSRGDSERSRGDSGKVLFPKIKDTSSETQRRTNNITRTDERVELPSIGSRSQSQVTKLLFGDRGLPRYEPNEPNEPRGPRGPEGAPTKNDIPRFLPNKLIPSQINVGDITVDDMVSFKTGSTSKKITNGKISRINEDGTYDIIYGNYIAENVLRENILAKLNGGSRKNLHKKTKKVTRRKNKKSPKRKTIKKRKIPKRKNKTRRNK